MRVIFRKNQMIISALAVMLAVAGYLTYVSDEDSWANTAAKGNENSLTSQKGDTIFELSDEDLLAENQNAAQNANVADANTPADGESGGNVDSTDIDAANANATGEDSADANASEGDIVSLDQDPADVGAAPGEAVLTSGMTIADYMAQSKLDREQTRGMNKEALLEIINNDGLGAEEKQAAIDRMVAMNAIAEKENAAETLLKSKGFSDAIVSIQDGQVDVVIGKESLTDAEVAQVEDIVKRKTEIGVENIVISLVNTGNPKE